MADFSVAPSQLPPRVFTRLDSLDKEDREAAEMLNDPEVASDHKRIRSISLRRAAIAVVVDSYRAFKKHQSEAEQTRELLASGADPELAAMAKDDIARLDAAASDALNTALSSLVNSDDQVVASVILEVRAGTGGDEACIWAADLLDMYRKYATLRRWGFDVMEFSTEASVGGVRNAVVSIKGEGVWAELAFEAGVHSVKRVPATEAQGRIHTSTATVAVLPEPEEVDVKIDWANDVEEHVTTSQGPGGQNVNKVATAVQLKHKPTGIFIRMQESKSQQDNRQRARRLLMAKLHEIERRKQHEQRSAARSAQIGSGDRSEKIRTYRWKEGIVADERLPGEYSLRDVMAGDLTKLMADLIAKETAERLAAL
ncbi:MAG: PCRF domain-containing protein [Phycisphaerales bacterium]